MSTPKARKPTDVATGYDTSVPRTVVAAVLFLLGVIWIAVYQIWVRDYVVFGGVVGSADVTTPFPWMAKLEMWNYAIGFGLIFLGLIVSAHKLTPLGRGQGVVIGMVGSFIISLVWIVVYYFIGQETWTVPVLSDLGNWNLGVGVGFMITGFAFATKWE